MTMRRFFVGLGIAGLLGLAHSAGAAEPGPADKDAPKEFDSSYKRDEPIEFPLNRVIPGWTEGMQLVGKGGMIELEIPPELGYGARGVPGAIPPNARLHFLVELLDIE